MAAGGAGRPAGGGRFSPVAAAMAAAAAAVVGIALLVRAPAVTAWRVVPATVRPVALGRGTVLPPARLEAFPQVIGRVAKVFVREGDTVRGGDPLVELDGAPYAAQLEEARAALARAEEDAGRASAAADAATRKLQRARGLAGKRIASREYLAAAALDVEKAQGEQERAVAALGAARARFSAARDSLARTRVVAPAGGRVAEVRVRAGQTVSEGSAVAEIAEPFARVSVEVRGRDAEGIAAGAPARVQAGRSEAPGVVRSVAPANKTGGSPYVTVMIALATPTADLAPGRPARARIEGTPRADVLAVPLAALAGARRGTGAAVWALDAERVHRRTVETGAAGESLVEVRSGLRAGETIVGGPASVVRRLEEGERVRVKGE